MPVGLAEELQQPINSQVGNHKLGDGCRHVFIDAGANRAVHTRYLMEEPPSRAKNFSGVFPVSRFLRMGHFKRLFGPDNWWDPTVCAFAFEPNPTHARRLRSLELRLRAAGRRMEVFNAAVSNQTGRLHFANPSFSATNKSEWGFQRSLNETAVGVRVVPVIDLAAFVLDELVSRQIPPPPPSMKPAHVREPAIIMKLDVEGAELAVLERMRVLGVLCKLDTVVWEFHPNYWRSYSSHPQESNVYERYPSLFDVVLARSYLMQGLHPGVERRQVKDQFKSASRLKDVDRQRREALKTSQGTRPTPPQCNASFFMQDDETYLNVQDVSPGRWGL